MEHKKVTKLEILDYSYKDVKSLKRWNNKQEFNDVKEVLVRFEELNQYRRSGCWWDQVPTSTGISLQDIMAYNGGSSTEGGGTSNWNHHWNYMLKAYIMWHRYVDNQSNVKSPLTWATAQAMFAQFQSANQTVSLNPRNSLDSKKINVSQEYLRNWEVDHRIALSKLESFMSAVSLGTAITYQPWIEKITQHKVTLPGDKAQQYLSELQNGDEEAQKKYQYLKEQFEKNKPITKVLDIIDYQDPAVIPISLFEFYPDNHASVMQGLKNEAQDCDWRRIWGDKQFRSEFENLKDPYIIKENINKVISANLVSDMYGDGDRFFRIPSDLVNTKGKVVVHQYYNKPKDLFLIVANDVLIRKGPLPYDHGQLPFSRYVINPYEDQFYGISMCDQTESLQNVDETLLNMYIDTKKISQNPPMIINDEIFTDIEEQYTKIEPGVILRASGSVGGDNIRWFEGPESRTQDLTSFREMISQDIMRASGVNDLAYASQPAPDQAVRNTMQSMQATQALTRAKIAMWCEGYIEAINQVFAILCQKMPERLEENPENILLKNIKLEEDEETGEISKTNRSGDFNYEMKAEHFIFEKNPKVIIDIDSLLPMGKNLAISRSEMVMTPPMMEMLSNQQYLQNPLIMALMKDFFVEHGYTDEITNYFSDSDSGEQDMLDAENQNKEMAEGKNAIAEPGRSREHLTVHFNFLVDLFNENMGKADTSENNSDKVDLIKKNQNLQNTFEMLLTHYQIDATPPINQPQAIAGMVTQMSQQASPSAGAPTQQIPKNQGQGGQLAAPPPQAQPMPGGQPDPGGNPQLGPPMQPLPQQQPMGGGQ